MSTVLRPPADALVTILQGLGLNITRAWLPQGITKPAAVVELPTIEREDVEQPEPELGHELWRLTYPVTLVFALREAATAQDRATDAIEQFIAAIDADPSLAGTAYEAAVTSANVEYDRDGQPNGDALVLYRTQVSVWKFV